jgi:4-phosphopantoate--beta-alanine ligase
MQKIPRSHPRYKSLISREKISDGVKRGLTHPNGLIAHGRGEAFDYLIGEKTTPYADDAERISAVVLLNAKNPVLSINGNVAALCSKEYISLSESINAKLEVNLFHRTNNRMNAIIELFEKNGAKEILGKKADKKIPGLDHDRGLCDFKGIFTSDVILVPLEDGDRCQALRNMGKTVVTIDLNPLSRTAKSANITIVDNVIRAIPNIEKWSRSLKNFDKNERRKMFETWDNRKNLQNSLKYISKRINSMY